jgi:hypothetical protein
MSIRMVAVELYRVIRQVEQLEIELKNLPWTGSENREEVESRLRKARSEKDRLKKMMEGAKDD